MSFKWYKHAEYTINKDKCECRVRQEENHAKTGWVRRGDRIGKIIAGRDFGKKLEKTFESYDFPIDEEKLMAAALLWASQSDFLGSCVKKF